MKRMRAYGIKYWATFRGELPAHFKTKKEVIHHIREERKKGIEVFRETARLKKLEEQALRKELRVERALDMLEMRKTEKLTLDQIGKRFNPPLTRERVRQIIAAELSLELQSEFKHYKKVASVLAHCPVCNKVKRVSLVWFKGEGKHYCAEHRPKLSAEERRAKKLDYCRNRYSSPSIRATHAISMKRYYSKVMADPVKKAYRLNRHNNYMRRKMATDKEFKDRVISRQKEYMKKRMLDPIFKEQFRLKGRIRNAKWRAKKSLSGVAK